SGEAADIHLATAAGEPPTATEALYVLKVARASQANAHLDTERENLTTLLGVAGTTTYRHYLPALVDSFPTADRPPRRINVFRWEPGFHTLEQVHARHPALDGRHLAWVFKRLLTVLGFSHRQNIIHGAVLPCHALIHAAGHGLQLVGWGRSVAVGPCLRTGPPRYKESDPPAVQHPRRPRPGTQPVPARPLPLSPV